MSKRTLTLAALLLAGPLAAMAPIASSAYAAPAGDFRQLEQDYWAYVLEQNPVLASSIGITTYDGQIADPSLQAEDARAARAAQFLTRLEAIPAASLPEADQVNRLILKRTLTETIEGNGYPQRMMLFTTYSGWHQDFAGMADNVPLRTLADFESYIARLKQYPTINDTDIAISDQAIAGGYVLPCDVLDGTEKGIAGVIAKPEASRFYAPFTKRKPDAISDADWQRLAAETRDVITNVLNPAYQKHYDWYVGTYKPACARAPGVSAQKGGKEFYEFRIRQMTTTDLTADQIHTIGLNEVKRIRADMVNVARAAGYDSREAFIQELRTDPKYYAKTPEELMEHVARLTKTIDGKMPGMFGRLPRLPYGIREIPAETAEGTTTAYYNPGSPETGISGTFYVNTSKLDQRPFWEIPALASHEAVPGHHNQIALQQELDLPDFRKYGAFFTAFVEGWGLYSERLGIEMGLYDTPAKDMGRLSYEMWRACRLVVDTGIHAKGWSKARAIAYMKDNTALTDANIEAEVNRYISWPGQALAYKLGELKIRELRARAEKRLGTDFDVREFHDVVLGQGAVPLDVLDAQVMTWLDGKAKKQGVTG